VYFERENADSAPTAVRLVALNSAYAERLVPLEAVTGIYPLMYRLVPARTEAVKANETPPPAQEEHSFTTRVSIEHD
jgi:hypothetical protein